MANKVSLKDYNIEKHSLDLVGFAQIETSELEHYQHPSVDNTSGEAKAYAGERLAELRSLQHLSTLNSDCIRLQPGSAGALETLEIQHHPESVQDLTSRGKVVEIPLSHKKL